MMRSPSDKLVKETQVNFVKKQNALCKDVIRMAKDWSNRQNWPKKSYFIKPKSFIIELLATIYIHLYFMLLSLPLFFLK